MRTTDRMLAALATGAAGAGVAGYVAGQPGVFVGAAVAALVVGAAGVGYACRTGRDTAEDGVVEGEYTETPTGKDLALSQVRGRF